MQKIELFQSGKQQIIQTKIIQNIGRYMYETFQLARKIVNGSLFPASITLSCRPKRNIQICKIQIYLVPKKYENNKGYSVTGH